jgi:2-polyprenyl-6-hydroxyphenyl methylase/3-demethylubiquinone-9 3-methyltransferase
MEQAVEPEQAACPVCRGATDLFDVVDFNKNCEEARGVYLPLSGRPIYYRRCQQCAFTFAPEFRKWSDEDFLRDIYNDRYIDVDPDYVTTRPLTNA